MSWNYRLIRLKDEHDNESVGVYEVYYDDNGKPNAYSAESVSLISYDGVDDLLTDIEYMLESLHDGVLTIEDFE